MKRKRLRSGFTTGACAAAAAKAAVELLLGAEARKRESTEGKKENLRAYERTRLRTESVEIPFPDGSRVEFKVRKSGLTTHNSELISYASVIKDAGDDPDVTNGAEIVAEATLVQKGRSAEVPKYYDAGENGRSPLQVIIKGGKGVGTVTKPGLPVPVGDPAINPVPRRMIEEAVTEAVGARSPRPYIHIIEITISVPSGEELAKKTLNNRLGITGGISILGTTGIVKPVSTEAWTATITSSMDVAKAVGLNEIVLSAGRTSEKAHMKKYGLPEEAYVLMGDHLEYSVGEAGRHAFRKIHLCAQWAKMVKIAMATPQTHVRFGAIDVKKAVEFLNSLGADIPVDLDFNTAREIFDRISVRAIPESGLRGSVRHELPLQRVCRAAKQYAESISVNTPVMTYLISYDGKVIAESE